MLRLNIAPFGVPQEIEVDEKRLLQFPEGLPGFDRFRRAILLNDESCRPFQWLQSVDNPDDAFLVTDPWLFRRDFAFDLPDWDARAIGVTEFGAESVTVLVLVTLLTNWQECTANFRAPIVINVANGKARQVILMDERLGIQERLFPVQKAPLPAAVLVR